MTYKEALAQGYKKGDQKFQRGYVSRKTDIDNQQVYEVDGNRKGQLYVELPTWQTTQYLVRQYLYK